MLVGQQGDVRRQSMSVSRLQYISGIGVNHIGDRADGVNDPRCSG
jgi:hypothetical protein